MTRHVNASSMRLHYTLKIIEQSESKREYQASTIKMSGFGLQCLPEGPGLPGSPVSRFEEPPL